MSRVVCNSGPLIALSKIGQTHLLRDLFAEALVSEDVRKEILAGGTERAGIMMFDKEPWL
jgi:predicted nucleic acid-binding protein